MVENRNANVFKCPTCRISIKHQRRESLEESDTAIEMITDVDEEEQNLQ